MFHILNGGFEIQTNILYSSESANNESHETLHNYLVNGQMARNKVRVKGIEILSAPSFLSTDIFLYTQFGDTYCYSETC